MAFLLVVQAAILFEKGKAWLKDKEQQWNNHKKYKMEITDLIKRWESVNMSDIYIFLYASDPSVFDSSAVHLQLYFPEMEIERVLCSDRQYHKLIRGFALEAVLERLIQYPCLVDDNCIRVLGVV